MTDYKELVNQILADRRMEVEALKENVPSMLLDRVTGKLDSGEYVIDADRVRLSVSSPGGLPLEEASVDALLSSLKELGLTVSNYVVAGSEISLFFS
jgi:hypothetical protein